MTFYRFTLIDYTFNAAGDSYIIDEPGGFDGFKIRLARDTEWHGVFTDFTVENLDIDGFGHDIIDTAYNEAGIEANMVLKIEYSCEGCENDDCYSEVYRARIDFGRSERRCGDVCEWGIVLQPESCINTLRNRYETKVDLDSLTAFDGTTTMEEYAALGGEVELPSKTIVLISHADTPTATTATSPAAGVHLFGRDIIPALPNIISEDLAEFVPQSTTYFTEWGTINQDEYFFEAQTAGNYDFEFRLKGKITVSTGGAPIIGFFLSKYTTSDNYLISDTPSATETSPNVWELDYDYTYANASETLNVGDRLYYFFIYGAINSEFEVITDVESYVNLTFNSTFDPTPAKLYLAHESFSRIAEAVTDGCMQVKSQYFGRTDSSPYNFSTDGCAGLQAITNGLLIRQAELQDGSEPKMTISMQELYRGMDAIHCIGMGIENDPITGAEVLTIEQRQDFYTDDVVLHIDTNNVTKQVNEAAHLAKVIAGYSKWEAEEFNGLDEFLTRREYRTNLTQTNAQLEILSDLIASGYAIEITRRKGKTSEDWRYDNDNFIICLERNGTYAQTFDVEQGNIDNATNIIDPATIYNYRISPIRNLLRWLWYIFASYKKPTDPNSKLIFTAGEANIVASGIMQSATCRIEAAITAENAEIDLYSLADFALPLWYGETIRFTAPLAYDEFYTIRENKYGLISYTCGDSIQYGWLQSMEYNLQEGEAEFTLIPKRDA